MKKLLVISFILAAFWLHAQSNTNYTGSQSLSGMVTSYNGELTAGNGVGDIVASIILTGQTTSIGSTTMYTAPSGGGLYETTIYLECTATSGTGTPTVTVSLGWTDDNALQGPIAIASGLSLFAKGYSSGSTTGTTSPKTMRLASGATVAYSVTINSPAGTPQYALYMTLKRVQ